MARYKDFGTVETTNEIRLIVKALTRRDGGVLVQADVIYGLLDDIDDLEDSLAAMSKRVAIAVGMNEAASR